MLAKIGKRWWLPVVFAFGAAFLGLLSAAYVNYNSEPMYIGRTTVMESREIQQVGVPQFKPGEQMQNLSNLAMTQVVMSSAARTLSALGVKLRPEQVLCATKTESVKDTNILAIEVTLPDPKEAKVTADVIAFELKKEYARLNAPLSKQHGESALKTIEPAFVRPVDQRHSLKLGIGLVGGFFSGIILGLILAALLPMARQPEPISQQQGV